MIRDVPELNKLIIEFVGTRGASNDLKPVKLLLLSVVIESNRAYN